MGFTGNARWVSPGMLDGFHRECSMGFTGNARWVSPGMLDGFHQEHIIEIVTYCCFDSHKIFMTV